MQDQAGAASGSGDPDPPPPPPEHAAGEGGSSSAAAARLPSRNASSKYDFVKVKVWLGRTPTTTTSSRFLLSRMLTVTKIPNHVAIKIALELKKLLVDNSLLDVSQSDLEANLFKLMEKRGYGEDYINRYKMMTRFHHQRVPLVILVCGTACTGKSTIATQLAQRLNLPNVLQTDMVYELLRTSTDAPLTSVPVWARDFNSPEELITEFCRECRVVRKGLAGDLKKAMKDGKPIIIEMIIQNREKVESGNPSIVAEKKTEQQSENGLPENTVSILKEDIIQGQDCLPESRTNEGLSSADSHEITSDSEEKILKAEGNAHKDLDQQKNNSAKKDKPAAEPIVVPIVLRMSDFDHKALLEEWIATRAIRDNCLPQDHRKLINNLKLIQDYLCSFESQGLTVVDISANSFPQTLDWLHGYLLQCIERGLLAACSEGPKQ
ncbi:hypothetical protein ZWY2020_037164 [Hordeum vulgare]|nr:hypothetical protein ZWY2020_037164 [Hordeum vulgare]